MIITGLKSSLLEIANRSKKLTDVKLQASKQSQQAMQYLQMQQQQLQAIQQQLSVIDYDTTAHRFVIDVFAVTNIIVNAISSSYHYYHNYCYCRRHHFYPCCLTLWY